MVRKGVGRILIAAGYGVIAVIIGGAAPASERRASAGAQASPPSEPVPYRPTHAPAALDRDRPVIEQRAWSLVTHSDGVKASKPQPIASEAYGAFRLVCTGERGARLNCTTRENWSGARALAFSVVPDGAMPATIQVSLFLKDGDYCWYETTSAHRPTPGRAREYIIPLDGSAVWRNVGHGKPLSAYSLQDVQEFGIGLFCEQPLKGTIAIEDFRLLPLDEPAAPLRLTEYRESDPAVGCYERYEVRFRLNRVFDNPFDPDQIDITAQVSTPSGATWSVFGFFGQDYARSVRDGLEHLTATGSPYWAVRIVPREAGPHTYRLTIKTPGETIELAPRAFSVAPSSRKGYVRVSTALDGPTADPVHFEFESGDVFFPLGHSVHASVDEHYHRMQKLPLPAEDRKTLFYDEAFARMARAGETFTEIWMCPWWMELEWRGDWFPFKGLGRYNQETAWRLDYLFSLAGRYGIYLQIALMNHGELTMQVDADWPNSPYNTKNGGFLDTPGPWFTDERAQKLWRQKLRYIAARWGGDPHLFGWVLISESDLTGPYTGWALNDPTYRGWAVATARYLRSIDPGAHPITNHYFGDYAHLDKKLFAEPEMDYLACDCYRCGPQGEGRDLVDLLLGTVALSREMGKPIVVSEYGGDWCGAMDNKLKADQHGGLWAAYMCGMTSTPLFWWFGFVEHHDLYGTYAAFSRFVAGEDRRGKPATSARLDVALPAPLGTPVKAIARVGEAWLDAWIYEDRALPIIDYFESRRAFDSPAWIGEEPWSFHTITGASVRVEGFKPGAYTAEFWNTVTGAVISRADVTVADDGALTIATPTFVRDLAVKVRPE
ncbi:MAG: DUF5060 domain-containing protein [Verrucomicrobia bacterium]|nr:DUF5060 domain-containing protein [Verrucomicrobiota bacterium]